MTPKEKAEWLKIKFFILPDEVEAVGRLKGYESKQLAKRCAIICVGQIIETLTDLKGFWQRDIVDPIKYWNEVLGFLKQP